MRKRAEVAGQRATATCQLSKRRLRKVFAPEHLPARNGSTVSAEMLRQLANAPWRGALSHGADQDDYGAEIHLRTEEPYRRWRNAIAATITVTTESSAGILLLRQVTARPSAPRGLRG